MRVVYEERREENVLLGLIFMNSLSLSLSLRHLLDSLFCTASPVFGLCNLTRVLDRVSDGSVLYTPRVTAWNKRRFLHSHTSRILMFLLREIFP